MKNFIPKPYQPEGIKWLVRNPESGLMWAPGLGKTAVTLAMLEVLKHHGQFTRVVLISTPAIVTTVWPNEIEKWGCTFNYKTVCGMTLGARSDYLSNLPKDLDILAINFQLVARCFWSPKLKQFCEGAILIVDESQHMAAPNGVNFSALRRNLHRFQRRHILTATPRSEGLLKLWTQAFIMDMGRALEFRIGLFREKYFYPSGFQGRVWLPKPKTSKKIRKKLRTMVLRQDETVLKMPDKLELDLVFKLPQSIGEQYKTLEREFIVWLDSQTKLIADTTAAKSQKLRQMVSGIVYVEGNPVQVHEEKLSLLLQTIDSLNERPVLLLYEYKSERDMLVRKLAEFKPKTYSATQRGSHAIIKLWNMGDVPILISHAASIGEGTNLQDAQDSVVVWYTLPWSAARYEQTNARLWRQGRKESVLIYRMLGNNTIDTRRVLPLLNEKIRKQRKWLNKLKR